MPRTSKWNWKSHLTPKEAAWMALANAAADPIDTLAHQWRANFGRERRLIMNRAMRRARSAALANANSVLPANDAVRSAQKELHRWRKAAAASAVNGNDLDRLTFAFCVELAEDTLRDAIATAKRSGA